MKGKVITIIVASSFLLAGIGVLGAGFIVADGVYTTFNGYNSVSYDLDNSKMTNLINLVIKANATDVIFSQSEDDTIHFVYDEVPFTEAKIELNGTEDTLTYQSSWKKDNIFDYLWWIPDKSPKLEVFIPETMILNLTIDVNACDVVLDKTFSNSNSLTIKANSSDFLLKNQTFKQLDIAINSSDITLDTVYSELEDSRLTLKAISSDIKYANVKFAKIEENVTSSDIISQKSAPIITKEYKLDSDSSDHYLYLDTPDDFKADIKTNSSDMHLNLKGTREDYNFTIEKRSTDGLGGVITNNASAAKQIKIKSNSSDYLVKFYL